MRTKRKKAESLQQIANRAAARFRTLPIVVRRGRMRRGDYGYCSLKETSMGPVFEIVLSGRLKERASLERTLEHEIAHAVAWFNPTAKKGDDHGPEFGVALAAVYRLLTGVR